MCAHVDPIYYKVKPYLKATKEKVEKAVNCFLKHLCGENMKSLQKSKEGYFLDLSFQVME